MCTGLVDFDDTSTATHSRTAGVRLATPTAAVELTATEAEDQVDRRLLLDVVVAHDRAILELLAQEDDPLVVGRDVHRVLLLDFGLDAVDRVVGMHVVESDRLA